MRPATTKSPTLVDSSLTNTSTKPTESYHHTSVSTSAAIPPDDDDAEHDEQRRAQRPPAAPTGGARGGSPDPPSDPSGRAEPSPGPVGPSNHSERLTALLVPPSGIPRVDRGEQCTPATCAPIGHHGPVTDAPQPVTDPLTLAALDTERHVARSGWDQPVRLFALVPTQDLLAARTAPRRRDGRPRRRRGGAERRRAGRAAARPRAWRTCSPGSPGPTQVAGCALAVERIVVPPEAERELPDDDAEALRAVAEHPGRADVRLLVAVTRDGSARCLLRQRDHDSDDRVALGEDIAPGPGARAAGDLQRRLSGSGPRAASAAGRQGCRLAGADVAHRRDAPRRRSPP